MLSESQKTSQSDLLILSDSYLGWIVAKNFLDLKVRVAMVELSPPSSAPDDIVLHIGNGEIPENARLIFGKDVCSSLWGISELNYDAALSLFDELDLPRSTQPLAWFTNAEREASLLEQSVWARHAKMVTTKGYLTTLHERALSFSRSKLESRLKAVCLRAGMEHFEASEIRSVNTGSLEGGVNFQSKGQSSTLTAPIVISTVASQIILPSLREKWIPVTLPSFVKPLGTGRPKLSMALFNMGADFAIFGHQSRFGSYRNLYQDKAVGVHTKADPVALAGVSQFFEKLGWWDYSQPTGEQLCVETLSCDGLPLVGPLSEAPGLYVIGGFAGRTQNFIFEVSRKLARALVKGASLTGMEAFSTKRFL